MRQKWKKGAKNRWDKQKKSSQSTYLPSISVTTLNINGLNTHNLKAQLIIPSMESLQLGETMQ